MYLHEITYITLKSSNLCIRIPLGQCAQGSIQLPPVYMYNYVYIGIIM